jgi:hypothetical protein
MSEKKSSENEMHELAWASAQLRQRIATRGSVKERIRYAARLLQWKFSRTKAVWYADERVALKARELRQIEELTGVTYGRQELRSVEALIARADTLAATQADESVYSAFAAAFRTFMGALDRSGTGGD